jgi:uncharacterized membrane protein YedE/YeeE
MEHFTPVSSLLGGILIGLSATATLALLGRVAGISGIVGGLLSGERNELAWRAAFVGGLLAGGLATTLVQPAAFAMTLERSTPALAIAGLLVGFGSRLGSGCTSGHGVCGIARGSARSIAATVAFMTTGALTALVITQVCGGRL